MPAYTASIRDWLFSPLEQAFIQPGTDHNTIELSVKFPMTVQNLQVPPVDQILNFTVDLKPQTGNKYSFPKVNWNPRGLYVTYISGQNMPSSEPLQSVVLTKSQLSLAAFFPAYANIVNGFAIAALTSGNNSSTFQQASDNSLAGPASIELTN